MNYTCPNCSGQVIVPDVSEPAAPKLREAPKDVLEWCEDILERMMRGVIRFIFKVFPSKMVEWLHQIFPWSVKLIRVGLFLILWLLLLLWPWLLRLVFSKPEAEDIYHSPFYNVSFFVWVLLAIVGSGWGLVHITLRRRRAKMAAASRASQTTPTSNTPPPLPALEHKIIYVMIENQQRGPYTAQQVRHMLSTGQIPDNALFSREGMTTWESVRGHF